MRKNNNTFIFNKTYYVFGFANIQTMFGITKYISHFFYFFMFTKITPEDWFTSDEQKEIYARIKDVDFQRTTVIINEPDDLIKLYDEASEKLLANKKKGTKYMTQHELGTLFDMSFEGIRHQIKVNGFQSMFLYKLCAITNTHFKTGGADIAFPSILNDEKMPYLTKNKQDILEGKLSTSTVQGEIVINYALAITGINIKE